MPQDQPALPDKLDLQDLADFRELLGQPDSQAWRAPLAIQEPQGQPALKEPQDQQAQPARQVLPAPWERQEIPVRQEQGDLQVKQGRQAFQDLQGMPDLMDPWVRQAWRDLPAPQGKMARPVLPGQQGPQAIQAQLDQRVRQDRQGLLETQDQPALQGWRGRPAPAVLPVKQEPPDQQAILAPLEIPALRDLPARQEQQERREQLERPGLQEPWEAPAPQARPALSAPQAWQVLPV